jgi:triacylglycerol lipase
MSEIKSIIILIALTFYCLNVCAQEDNCNTKYPVILVHGIGYRDKLPFKTYWGKIPKYLEKNGAIVYVANIDAFGTIESNAVLLKKIILEIIELENCEKVNIIAHSKGGLDSRYMISKLDMSQKTASLTTISTPHRGSVWADLAIGTANNYNLLGFAEKCSYLWSYILGDTNPDPLDAYYELTTTEMAKLNFVINDIDSVYYQCYGSCIRDEYPRIFLKLKNKLISENDGENDGVVPASSFRWTNFNGFAGENTDFGVSHFDIIGFTNCTFFDEKTFFKNIVIELKEMGF